MLLQKSLPWTTTLAAAEPDLAPQRRPGVLAVAYVDQPAPDDARPRLGRAVAAHVDARAHPARTPQLAAHRDLLDRLVVAPQRALDPRVAGDQRRRRAQLGLEVVNRLAQRRERALVVLAAAPADDHVVGRRHRWRGSLRGDQRRDHLVDAVLARPLQLRRDLREQA